MTKITEHDGECHLMYDEPQNIPGWKWECTCKPQEQVKPELAKTGTYRIEIGDILADFGNNQDEERAVRCLFDVVATEKRRQAEEIVKMIEKKKTKESIDPITGFYASHGEGVYNKALEDIITLIKEKYLNPLD